MAPPEAEQTGNSVPLVQGMLLGAAFVALPLLFEKIKRKLWRRRRVVSFLQINLRADTLP
jgi:hypothetical protein